MLLFPDFPIGCVFGHKLICQFDNLFRRAEALGLEKNSDLELGIVFIQINIQNANPAYAIFGEPFPAEGNDIV